MGGGFSAEPGVITATGWFLDLAQASIPSETTLETPTYSSKQSRRATLTKSENDDEHCLSPENKGGYIAAHG